MKSIHFLPPAVALVIAGAWLVSQRQSIATLESQSSLLRKEITARRAAGNAGDVATGRSAAPVTTNDKGPIDWKKIAAQFEESQNSGDIKDMRAMMRLSQRVMAMDKNELAAALDEIAALDLSDQSRMTLESMLIGPLIEKDPEFALSQFIGRINAENGGMGWQLSSALAEWAKKDPTAAAAWFDRQIAAGTFDSKSLAGKNQHRLQFEGAMIGPLLSSNPEAAALRLAALPEDQRRDILRNAGNSLKKEDQLAYAKLVRQSLPEKERIERISALVSRKARTGDDYAAVTECLERIEATPAERDACIEKSAESRFQKLSYQRKITVEDIEQLRTWTKSQSPELTDRATGTALAGALQGKENMDFSEIAALAVDYHDASGSDEVLIPLLKSWPSRENENKEQARALAGKISDETVRKEILKQLK